MGKPTLSAVHASRLPKYTMNFAVNANTGQFLSKRDNHIVKIETTNCTVSTIAGNAPTLPFALTKDVYYTVVITPTNPLLVSSVNLITRLNVQPADEIINVIDLNNSLWNGNKLYVLTDTQLLIFDASKFATSNYLGAGQFTVSPYVETVTLPTMPTGDTGYLGTFWSDLIFVKHTGVLGKMLIVGKNRTDAAYGCYYAFLIDINDNSITNLSNQANSITTTIGGGGSNLNPYCNVMYDYVNELAYPIGLNQTLLNYPAYNLVAGTISVTGNDVKKGNIYSSIKGIRNFFNPFTQSFSKFWWCKILDSTYVTQNSQILGFGVNSGGFCYQYNYKDGYYYGQSNNSTNYISKLDNNGNKISEIRMNPDVTLGGIFYLLNADIGILMNISISTLRVGWISLTDNSKSYNYIQSTDVLSGQTAFKHICSSKANNTFFTIGTSGTATRLYCFKPNVASQSMDVMYYDLPANITVNSINTNQLLK